MVAGALDPGFGDGVCEGVDFGADVAHEAGEFVSVGGEDVDVGEAVGAV